MTAPSKFDQDQQLAELTDAIVSLARLDFDSPPSIRGAGPLDAVAAGLIALGEELQASLTARDAAEAANAAKAAFLADMSHELRTPLTSIIGCADLLQETALSQQQAVLVRRVGHAGEILLRLISDILDFSKLEAGKLQIDDEVFSPLASIEAVLEQHRSAATSKGLALAFCCDGLDKQTVRGDHGRFEQILSNLLNNAIKFTPSGGVEIFAQAHEVGQDLELRVDVTDTGIGISQEDQANIFERYMKGREDGGHRQGGTGLGLSISRSLAEHMGGLLRVNSAEGKGSTFGLELRLPTTLQDSNSPSFQTMRSGLGLTVLVVDDTETVRAVTADMLRVLGCEVSVVDSGPRALLEAARSDFDVILMDCQMPGMDGLETTRQLLGLYPERRFKVVAITAHTARRDAVRSREAGMVGHLNKPYTLRQLRAELVKLCHTEVVLGPGERA